MFNNYYDTAGKIYCFECDTMYLTVKQEQEKSAVLLEALEKLLATGDRNKAIEVIHMFDNMGGE